MRTGASHAGSATLISGDNVVVAKAVYVAQAKQQYDKQSDNDIEIDEDPAVSIAEEGAWVAAWVWVSREEAGLRKETRARAAKIKK